MEHLKLSPSQKFNLRLNRQLSQDNINLNPPLFSVDQLLCKSGNPHFVIPEPPTITRMGMEKTAGRAPSGRQIIKAVVMYLPSPSINILNKNKHSIDCVSLREMSEIWRCISFMIPKNVQIILLRIVHSTF